MVKPTADRIKAKSAFTLVEIMVATALFLTCIGGVVYSYLKCMELQDIGRNVSIATQAVRSKLEDIKATPFANISATFNNATFTANNINGKGVVYVTTTGSILQVKVIFCWKQQNGRVFGEDTNLNGVLNAGEDKNANGQLDSYVQVVTNIYG